VGGHAYWTLDKSNSDVLCKFGGDHVLLHRCLGTPHARALWAADMRIGLPLCIWESFPLAIAFLVYTVRQRPLRHSHAPGHVEIVERKETLMLTL
jgi:hypothetical protein